MQLSKIISAESNPFGCNVGEMSAEMIAAAGVTLPCGCRITCETDLLAMSGATFPTDVTRDEMEDFNRRTMRNIMDEAAERKRYEAISEFFKRGVK